jgi:hypothetical protein
MKCCWSYPTLFCGTCPAPMLAALSLGLKPGIHRTDSPVIHRQESQSSCPRAVSCDAYHCRLRAPHDTLCSGLGRQRRAAEFESLMGSQPLVMSRDFLAFETLTV